MQILLILNLRCQQVLIDQRRIIRDQHIHNRIKLLRRDRAVILHRLPCLLHMRVHPCQDKVLFPELSLKFLCIQIHQARLPRIPAKCRRPEHNLPAFSQAACLSDAPGSCLPSASSSCLSAASSTSFLVDIRVQLPERLNAPVSPFSREIQVCPADANRLHLPVRPVHRRRKWFHRRFRADGDQAQVPVHISMIPLRNIVLRIIPELLIAAAGMPQLDNHRVPLLPAGSNRQEIVADNDH